MDQLNIYLNVLNILAGLVIGVGIYLELGLGWSLVFTGAYLAYNVITTIKVLHVRDSKES